MLSTNNSAEVYLRHADAEAYKWGFETQGGNDQKSSGPAKSTKVFLNN